MNHESVEVIEVRSLSVGDVLDIDILDNHGVLLLRSGTPVTLGMLQQLQRRKIRTLRTRCAQRPASAATAAAMSSPQPNPCAAPTFGPTPKLETPHRAESGIALDDARLDNFDAAELDYPDETARRVDRLNLAALQRIVRDGGVQRTHMVAASHVAVGQVMRGSRQGCEQAAAAVQTMFQTIRQDSSVAALIMRLRVGGAAEGDYLYDHCVDVSMLTMSLAYHLGFSETQVVEAGLGALLHDIGMLRLPQSIRMSNRTLTPMERIQIRTHPTHAANMLERIGGVPMLARLVAYQLHERVNGGGYPRGRGKMFIHPLARVAGLADSFVAMVSPRVHRPAMLPHLAMHELIHAARHGLFEADLVRAALDHLSAYPVGSFVRLNDKRTARVIRANPGEHTRPVVVTFDTQGKPAGFETDLTYFTELSIAAAVDPTQTNLAA